MLTFKKVVAVIVMVLSALSVLLLIIALIGSWVARARLETAGTQLLLAAEQAITSSREGMVRVDALLQTSGDIAGEVDTRLRSIETRLVESESIVSAILDTIGGNLGPSLALAVERFNQIEANIIAINEAVTAVQAIPFLGLQSSLPGADVLLEVEARMTQIREEVQALQQTIRDTRTELIEGRVGNLTSRTGQLVTSINTTQDRLRALDGRLAENVVVLVELRERLPRLLLMATILLNLIFALSVLAFVSLFVHAWSYFKCTEDGLEALLPGECETLGAGTA